MKPLHVFLLLFAVFITALADGISFGLSILPGIGLIIGLALTFCINITMGSGLVLLLALNGMYHPKWGPAGLIGGLIPGLDFLPFWLGIVIAGIAQDMSKEKGLIGAAAGMVVAGTSVASGNVTGAVKGVAKALPAVRQVTAAEAPADENRAEQQTRTPSTLQTKNFDGIRAANDNTKLYVPKAA